MPTLLPATCCIRGDSREPGGWRRLEKVGGGRWRLLTDSTGDSVELNTRIQYLQQPQYVTTLKFEIPPIKRDFCCATLEIVAKTKLTK